MLIGVGIRVSGRVQGVGFRYHTLKQASAFQVSGFVQNLPDGSVYIEAEGEPLQIEAFVEWCRQGPPYAWVEGLDVRSLPVINRTGFYVN